MGVVIGRKPSSGFTAWLREVGATLAVSAYSGGQVMLVGVLEGRVLSTMDIPGERPMGLAFDRERGMLVLANRGELRRFKLGHQEGKAILEPVDRKGVGELDLHDVAWTEGGPVVAATKINCVVGADGDVRWKPPFIGEVVEEDRCHLNGLAAVDGELRYVTVCGQRDEADGWREKRNTGAVLRVSDGAVMVSGLRMPHSPRWYEGRLWLLESGRGRLGYVEGRMFHPVAELPGYPRGLAFVEGYAIVGVSRFRYHGPDVEAGLVVVDLGAGEVVHRLVMDCKELFDVEVIPGESMVRPKLTNGPLSPRRLSDCAGLEMRLLGEIGPGEMAEYAGLIQGGTFWRRLHQGLFDGGLTGVGAYADGELVGLALAEIEGGRYVIHSLGQSVPCSKIEPHLKAAVKRLAEKGSLW